MNEAKMNKNKRPWITPQMNQTPIFLTARKQCESFSLFFILHHFLHLWQTLLTLFFPTSQINPKKLLLISVPFFLPFPNQCIIFFDCRITLRI
jgi:hypothetical protein